MIITTDTALIHVYTLTHTQFVLFWFIEVQSGFVFSTELRLNKKLIRGGATHEGAWSQMQT